jgi:hypothetical protein
LAGRTLVRNRFPVNFKAGKETHRLDEVSLRLLQAAGQFLNKGSSMREAQVQSQSTAT